MMDTTPIENLLFLDDEWYNEALALISLHMTLQPVEFHKHKLGQQARTWNGEFRFWIWENLDKGWVVYVSNKKGVCFEVDASFDRDLAIEAWQDYRNRMTA